MGLFHRKKEETTSCCCSGNCTPEAMGQAETEKSAAGVKVLGGGEFSGRYYAAFRNSFGAVPPLFRMLSCPNA